MTEREGKKTRFPLRPEKSPIKSPPKVSQAICDGVSSRLARASKWGSQSARFTNSRQRGQVGKRFRGKVGSEPRDLQALVLAVLDDF